VTPAEHAARRGALAARVQREFAQAWARAAGPDVRTAWFAEIPRLLVLLTTAQRIAASSADSYVAGTLGEPSPYEVVPGAFSQTASDGRALDTLLAQPVVQALSTRSLGAGQALAELIGHTQVADAGRTADLTASVAHPSSRSWTRMIVGKTCARCLILAGRRYGWKADFNRHPRCDCIAVPSAEAITAAAPVSPAAAFKEMDRAEQDRVFGRAGAEAIRNGADMAQVVNARQGMTTVAGKLLTRTGGGRRPRLMPEQIFREAGGDRAEAIRLLSLHGYIRRRAQGLTP
jgi:hypothetical protein